MLSNNAISYAAIQQVSFEFEDFMDENLAIELRKKLVEILQTEVGEPSQKQINQAMKLIQPYDKIRERNKQFIESYERVRYSFSPVDGEVSWIGYPPSDARLLVCPKCGYQTWDKPLTPNERRLCFRHFPFVYFIDKGPLPIQKSGG